MLEIIYKKILTLKRNIYQSRFQKSVFIMGTGTLFTQIIGVISSPIIARLYSPSDYGILALFVSILSICIVMSSLRYEISLPLQKEDGAAANILALCILLLFANSIIFSLILYLVGSIIDINTYFALNTIKPYFWLLTIGFLGAGLYNILNYWVIRQGDYSRITATRINQTISGVASKILMGLFLFGPLGLILGHVISQIVGINTFIMRMLKKDRARFSLITYRDMKSVAKQNSNFPLFLLPASILNSITLASPVIMLSSIYGLEVTGWYSFAYGILVSPGLFISASMSQVYYGELSIRIREKKETLTLFLSATRKLALIGIPLIGIPALLAPLFFPIVFGDNWKVAGLYCLPLSLMAIAAFCVSPTVHLSAFGYNHWQLLWDISRLSLVISGFFITIYLKLSPMESLFIFSFTMTLLYLVHFFMNIRAIKNNIHDNTTKP